MSEPADVVIIQQPPAAKVVIAAEGVSPTGGGVTEVSAADATITVAGTPDHPTLKVTSGTFDASGAASTAQSTAESFATAAVATETTRAEAAEASLATSTALTAETARAEAAEALLLPKTGGTMSGAIAMGAHKVTGLTNGSASDDAAAFGQIPAALPPNGSASGDLSGSFPSPTVAKINGTALSGLATGILKNTTGTGVPSIASAGTDYMAASPTWTGGDLSGTGLAPTVAKVNGVSISAAEATLLSQMNGAVTRNTSTLPASAVAGEQTVLLGSTASTTLTLPASTAQVSSENQILNLASVPVTIAAGLGTTLNYLGTSGSFILAPNTSIAAVLIGTVWYIVEYSGIGQQVAESETSAATTAQPASTSTWLLASTTSGAALSITLPNDNRLYRVEWIASQWHCATVSNVWAGIGTSTTTMLATTFNQSVTATGVPFSPVVNGKVTGTGQVLNVYVLNGTNTGASFLVTVAGGATLGVGSTPQQLIATRVG